MNEKDDITDNRLSNLDYHNTFGVSRHSGIQVHKVQKVFTTSKYEI